MYPGLILNQSMRVEKIKNIPMEINGLPLVINIMLFKMRPKVFREHPRKSFAPRADPEPEHEGRENQKHTNGKLVVYPLL